MSRHLKGEEGDCSNAASSIANKNQALFSGPMTKDPLPPNRSRSHLRGGMDLLLAMLEEERKKPAFYSFEIRHQPDAERPYPVDHELLSLIVSYHVPGEIHSREETRDIIRPHPSPYWYLCEDYHRKGKSLNRK